MAADQDTTEASAVALPITVTGVVVRGDQRGRQLGFPTANVDLAGGTVLPPDGVYAGWVILSEPAVVGASAAGAAEGHAAAISIGSRPTFYEDGGVVLLEAYLLDFEGDLYGETVQVVVEALVRKQVRFASESELIETMHGDVEQVRALTTGPA